MGVVRWVLWVVVYLFIGACIFGLLGLAGVKITAEYPLNLYWLAAIALYATWIAMGYLVWRIVARFAARSRRMPPQGMARVFTVDAHSYEDALSLAVAEARKVGFSNPRVDNYSPAAGIDESQPWTDGVLRKVQVAIAQERDR